MDAPPGTENEENDGDQEEGEVKQNGDEEEDLEDEDSDDDVNVVIRDIKTNTTTYSQQQHSIKRGKLYFQKYQILYIY